jgi:hypothetical protein
VARQDATPLGLLAVTRVSQGSSFLATLGWRSQSLWDCRNAGFSIGRADSSVALDVRKEPVLVGRSQIAFTLFRPSLRDLEVQPRNHPALKGWAIVGLSLRDRAEW